MKQLILFITLFPLCIQAQSIFETEANGDGIIFPRLTTSQQNALTPIRGQCVYNITNSRLECYNGVFWDAGVAGPAGPQGIDGATGATGAAGASGINCWDINGNGNNDLYEDTNGDGVFSALDCEGPAGATGATGATGPAGPQGPEGLEKLILLMNFPSNPEPGHIYLINISGTPTLYWWSGAAWFTI